MRNFLVGTRTCDADDLARLSLDLGAHGVKVEAPAAAGGEDDPVVPTGTPLAALLAEARVRALCAACTS